MSDGSHNSPPRRGQAVIDFYSILRQLVATLWAKRQELVRQRRAERLGPAVLPPDSEMYLGGSLGGLLLALVSLPLAVHAVLRSTIHPLEVLLLQQPPDALPADFFHSTLPDLFLPGARPLLFSLALMYGIVGIMSGPIVLSGGVPQLAIAANGLWFGYHLTRYVCGDLLHILSVDTFTGHPFMFRVIYLYLSFLGTRTLINLLGHDEYSRQKYDQLLPGINGIFSAWLLGMGSGKGAALFSGVVFLVLTLLTTALAEWIARPFFEMAEVALGEGPWKVVLRQRSYSLPQLLQMTRSVMTTRGPKFWSGVFAGALGPGVVVGVYFLVIKIRG